jgi:hypothetical protein
VSQKPLIHIENSVLTNGLFHINRRRYMSLILREVPESCTPMYERIGMVKHRHSYEDQLAELPGWKLMDVNIC